MMIPGTDKRVYSININTGGVINGLVPDGRAMIQRGRDESKQYEGFFGIKCPGEMLVNRLSMVMQMYTVYSSYRPVGTSVIVASHDAQKGF